MTKLAAQLATQVDYNNRLLSQVSKLESSQLRYHKESKDKADKLLKALKVVDVINVEVLGLRQKLHASETSHAKLTAQVREAQLDARYNHSHCPFSPLITSLFL